MSTGTDVIRFDVPSNLSNLAVSTPSGYICFLESPGVVICELVSTTTIAAGGFVDINQFATTTGDSGP